MLIEMKKRTPARQPTRPEKNYRDQFYLLDSRISKEAPAERLHRLVYQAFLSLDEMADRLEILEQREKDRERGKTDTIEVWNASRARAIRNRAAKRGKAKQLTLMEN